MQQKTLTIALLAFLAQPTIAGSIAYTFTGAAAEPSHAQSFQLIVPDFLPLVLDGPHLGFLSTDSGMTSCIPCESRFTALFFSRQSALGQVDQLQFNDANGTAYVYLFPINAFSNLGTYQTLGLNGNDGALSVSEVPEPSVAALILIGLGILGIRRTRFSWANGTKLQRESGRWQGSLRDPI